jgi:hypothetical protein
MMIENPLQTKRRNIKRGNRGNRKEPWKELVSSEPTPRRLSSRTTSSLRTPQKMDRIRSYLTVKAKKRMPPEEEEKQKTEKTKNYIYTKMRMETQ